MSTSIFFSENVPTWEKIRDSLKDLFSTKKLTVLELDDVQVNQRLQYHEFELIFYQFFLIIDQKETKRRFRTAYPARNQDERNKFIDLAVKYINDKQLLPKKVTAQRLKTYGGEPFRSIINAMIDMCLMDEEERCQQVWLKNPKNQEKLMFYEKLLPMVNITPIDKIMDDDYDVTLRSEAIKSSEILKIIDEFVPKLSDPKANKTQLKPEDMKIVVEVTKRHFK